MEQITFNIEEDSDDGGFVAEAFTQDNSQIITQGDTIEELKNMIKNALECHFDNPKDVPRKVILKFIRQEIFAF